MKMFVQVSALDPLEGGYLTENRLRNMRAHTGRRDAPIVVRRSSEAGRWEIVDGQHRAQIARERGEKTILATTDNEVKL